MRKKVIQVPIDEGLLEELNALSRKQRKARSELIREACAHYVAKAEQSELDQVYIEGYKRIPDDPAIGEAGLKLLPATLPGESW